MEALQQQWFASTGRLPDPEQLDRMVTAELDRDMLFQRALELDLHLYDTVVYQRLLLNMSFLQMGEGMTEQERYEQALEMRLHLGDEVVKRRLIQVMEQLLLGYYPPQPPTEADLLAEFETPHGKSCAGHRAIRSSTSTSMPRESKRRRRRSPASARNNSIPRRPWN